MTYIQHIDYGHPSWQLKVVSLHGFPGVRSKQNREIADGISQSLQARVRLLLYPGISCDGNFSFKRTLEALLAEFTDLVSEADEKVTLIGHSWGGFCSIVIAAQFPHLVKRLVLLSPLLKLNTAPDKVQAFFQEALVNNPQLKSVSAKELVDEFSYLSKFYDIEKTISKIDPAIKINFLQARTDLITPTAIAEQLRVNFRGAINYELVEQDHSFLIDRPLLSKKIAKLIG